MNAEEPKSWTERIKAEQGHWKPSTHVNGTLLVMNPTVEVLAKLFSCFITNPTEYDPRQMAEEVMKSVGQDVSHQIGPGLEVVTQTKLDTAVELNLSLFFQQPR